jgi:hypothetical protein
LGFDVWGLDVWGLALGFGVPLCGFPADVGVITNHQRQAEIGVWLLGFRCADLGLNIWDL